MRTRTISAICLLLAGIAIGLFFAPGKSRTVPEGDLTPRVKVVDAGMNMDVDLRLRNRPVGSRIEWHADSGKFYPEVTETDLKSTFTAPLQQGRVKLWVELIDGDHVYKDVASTYLDVSRSSPNGGTNQTSPTPTSHTTTVSESHPAGPIAITFITIPPYDAKGGPTTSADIEGQVDGVKDAEQYRIILYAKTDSTWWVQPLAAARYTLLDRNGRFFSWTHTGTRYAALLAHKGFVAPEAVDGELPSSPDIVSQKEVPGKRKGE